MRLCLCVRRLDAFVHSSPSPHTNAIGAKSLHNCCAYARGSCFYDPLTLFSALVCAETRTYQTRQDRVGLFKCSQTRHGSAETSLQTVIVPALPNVAL